MLAGERVVLRSAGDDDLPALCALFEEGEVARWWGTYDRGRIEREIVHEDDPQVTVYVIEVEGAVAGVIQSWEESDPDYRHASLDIALGTRWHGAAIAVDAIRTLARHLIEHEGHHHLTIDPATANGRAIACYAKVGFRPVGILRRHERGPDGTFHDTLLMDLLAEELS